MNNLKVNILNSAKDRVFKNIHGNRLIYNTCWEDPRIDRELMKLDGQSKVVMITSAGCNALDYLLDSPERIHTVDMNYRQNSLLHLKLTLLQHESFDNFFQMFGVGTHSRARQVYANIRSALPSYAQEFWDKKIHYFQESKFKGSFYYYGTSGDVAWLFKNFLKTNRAVNYKIYKLFAAKSLDEQREIYQSIEPEVWNRFVRWLVKHPVVMAMVGVPRAQVQLIVEEYPGGLVGYVQDSLRHLLTEIPIHDNYFWRVYLTGSYGRKCCPNYLNEENFELLRNNARRVHTTTSTLAEFLKCHPDEYTHYVLLDHQDWLAWHAPAALEEEWQLIMKNSKPGTKILMRSAAMQVDFIPDWVQEAVKFHPELTEPLHLTDRVGTYGSLHFAEVL